MSKPPKIDRKTLKGPDEFQKRGVAILSRIPLERLPVYPIFGVLIGGLAIYFGYQWWTQKQDAKAWSALHQAEQELEAKRWDALAAFHKQYASDRPAVFAAGLLGDHYFDLAKKAALADKPEEAKTEGEKSLEWYAKALSHGGLSANERQLYLIDRAGIQEILGRLDEAKEDFTKASEVESGVAKAMALLGVARVWELKSDQTKAIEFYDRVAVEFPGSQYGTMAKTHLRRLKSPMFVGEKKS